MIYLGSVKTSKMTFNKYIIKEWKLALLVLFIIIIGQLCLVLWGLNVAKLVTSLANTDFQQSTQHIIFLVVIFLLWKIQIITDQHYFSKFVHTMNISMREDMVIGLIQSDIPNYRKYDVGALVSWLTNDITMINNQGYANLHMMISQISGIVFSVGAIVTFNPSIVLVIALLSVLMLFVPTLFTKNLNEKMETVSRMTDVTTNLFSDNLAGFEDFLMSGNKDYLLKQINEGSIQLKNSKLAYATSSGKMLGATNGVSLFSQIILLSFTGWLYYQHFVPIGAISGVQYFAATIFSSLTGLSANYIELKSVNPIFDKFNSALTTRNNLHINKKKEVNTLHQQITLNNISFNYDNDKAILSNINFIFKKNGKYAVLGESGKGKTTLLELIAGNLRDYKGEIYWDKTPYSEIDYNSLRNQIMYIKQKPYIFNASIRQNITFNHPISDEALNGLLDKVKLTDWVNSLDAGVDTIISYNHKNISGGQLQKIAIARGLMNNKSVFLLDEITTSIDLKSALEIEHILLSEAEATVILVTHRLSDESKVLLNDIYEFN